MDAIFAPSVLRRMREFAENVIQRREFEIRTQFERDWFEESTPVQPLLALLENPKTPPEIQIFTVEILWRRIVRDDGALELLEKKENAEWCLLHLRQLSVWQSWHPYVLKKIIFILSVSIANSLYEFPEYRDIPQTIMVDFSPGRVDTAFVGCRVLLKFVRVKSVHWRDLPAIYQYAMKCLAVVDGEVPDLASSCTKLLYGLLSARREMVGTQDFEVFVSKFRCLPEKVLPMMCTCAEIACPCSNSVTSALCQLLNTDTHVPECLAASIVRCLLVTQQKLFPNVVMNFILDISVHWISAEEKSLERICDAIHLLSRIGKPLTIQRTFLNAVLNCELDTADTLLSKELSPIHAAIQGIVPDLYEILPNEFSALGDLSAVTDQVDVVDRKIAILFRLSIVAVRRYIRTTDGSTPIELIPIVFQSGVTWNEIAQNNKMFATEMSLLLFCKFLIEQGPNSIQNRIDWMTFDDIADFVIQKASFVLSVSYPAIIQEHAVEVLAALIQVHDIPRSFEGLITMRPMFSGLEEALLLSVEYSRIVAKIAFMDEVLCAGYFHYMSEHMESVLSSQRAKPFPFVVDLIGLFQAADRQDTFDTALSLMKPAIISYLGILNGAARIPVLRLWSEIFRPIDAIKAGSVKTMNSATAMTLIPSIFVSFKQFFDGCDGFSADSLYNILGLALDCLVIVLNSPLIPYGALQFYQDAHFLSMFDSLFGILGLISCEEPRIIEHVFSFFELLCKRELKLFRQRYSEFFRNMPELLLYGVENEISGALECVLAYICVCRDDSNEESLVVDSFMEQIFKRLSVIFLNTRSVHSIITEILVSYLLIDGSFLPVFRQLLPKVPLQEQPVMSKILKDLEDAVSSPSLSELTKLMVRLRMVLFDPIHHRLKPEMRIGNLPFDTFCLLRADLRLLRNCCRDIAYFRRMDPDDLYYIFANYTHRLDSVLERVVLSKSVELCPIFWSGTLEFFTEMRMVTEQSFFCDEYNNLRCTVLAEKVGNISSLPLLEEITKPLPLGVDPSGSDVLGDYMAFANFAGVLRSLTTFQM